MHRGHSDKKSARHNPYGRISLPASTRKDLVRHISNSSPIRSEQPHRPAEKVEKSFTRYASPVKIERNSETDLPFETTDDNLPTDDHQTSDEDDGMLLAASSRFARAGSFGQRRGGEADGRPPAGQTPEHNLDKGKGNYRSTTNRHDYGAPPSSLGAGPSSTTWTNHPSEDSRRGVSKRRDTLPASIDVERFALEMSELLDEFYAQAKMKVEGLAKIDS